MDEIKIEIDRIHRSLFTWALLIMAFLFYIALRLFDDKGLGYIGLAVSIIAVLFTVYDIIKTRKENIVIKKLKGG